MGVIGWIVFGLIVGIAAKFLTPDDPVGFIMAVLGAIVLLVAHRMVARGPRRA